MDLYKAMYRVLIEGQAYLYAQHLTFVSESRGHERTAKEFQDWEDEWKIEAADELKDLMLDE